MNYKSEKIMSPGKAAFAGAVIMGMAAHLFALVNMLHNHDSIETQPAGVGAGSSSGRWLLDLLGRLGKTLFGNYNMPWLNGVLFILLLALAAAFLVSALKIKNRTSAVLVGAMFVVYPTVTSTMFYRFAVVMYGIAILLAVLAVWTLERYKKSGFVLSVLCIACSLGIYQAYVPMTISAFVLLMMETVMDGERNILKLLKKGLCYCATLICGVISYYLLLKLFLNVYNTSLSGYFGVDQMGRISLDQLYWQLRACLVCFVKLPFRNYWGLTETTVLRAGYLAMWLASAAMIVYMLFTKLRDFKSIFSMAVLCAVFPVALGFIRIMVPVEDGNTMTVYSYVLSLCLPFVLFERLPLKEQESLNMMRKVMYKIITISAAVIIFGYTYRANVNYTALYYANRQAENYVSSLITQVRMTEGFNSEKKWVFMGRVKDPMLDDGWQYIQGYRGKANMDNLIFIEHYIKAWSQHYMEVKIPSADADSIAEISVLPEFKSMPCWPDNGSIKVIDDYIVIKFMDFE